MSLKRKYKLVAVGSSGSGKSSILLRYARNEFEQDLMPTVGAAFFSKRVATADGAMRNFELWDTAGQERYRALAALYYREACAALVVYDITQRDTFYGSQGAMSWVAEVRQRAQEDIVIALVGNKIDREEAREVQSGDVEAFANREGILHFTASAKTGQGIDEIFDAVANMVPERMVMTSEVIDAESLRKAQKSSSGCGC
uniref:Uncharacterized protein n=2 Tax=Phaeomonas parva TaxID=124430 RepID=A0A7S1TTW6_9STRA|mmetsp:Transcript_14501/g.43574  ORF Transcript_14501/g.43574 Transcript_14501/m.43574 type:complete len:200 (+) Transcript_14501:231-830(+)